MGEVDGGCRLILHLWCRTFGAAPLVSHLWCFEISRKDVSLWTRCLVDGVKS